jgi:PAS domain S-box-containing protein
MENQMNLSERSSDLASWNDPRILVVEDDPAVCESIRALLGQHGFAVRTSENLLAALDALLDKEYDLVLLDLKLEDKCGFAVMDHLIERNLDTQVIVVTGHHSEKYAITALKKGATDYLKKPFDPDDLLASVNNVLSRQKYQREMSLLKAAVATSSAAIVVADVDGRIVYANAAYRRMMDLHDTAETDSSSIYGRHADQDKHVDEQIRRSLATGIPWKGKSELIDVTGQRFTVWKWVDPIPETIGGGAYGVALMHDMTAIEIERLGKTVAICASCKRVRDDDGSWNEIDAYLESHSDSRFSHTLCPQCARKLYPELFPSE